MLFLGASLNISAQNDVVTNETVLNFLRRVSVQRKLLVPSKIVLPEPLHSTSSLCVNSSKLVLMPR